MKPAPFTYHRATSAREAVDMLASTCVGPWSLISSPLDTNEKPPSKLRAVSSCVACVQITVLRWPG